MTARLDDGRFAIRRLGSPVLVRRLPCTFQRYALAREGNRLQFHFRDPKVQKTSVYWKEGKDLRFEYVLLEMQEDGEEKKVHFEGALEAPLIAAIRRPDRLGR